MLPGARYFLLLYPDADCSLCAEGYSRGIAYSCRKCSSDARGSAVGFTITLAVIAVLVTVMVLRRLGTVVDADRGEENDPSQGFARSRCASCQDLMIKVLPLSAIKIVVVVWQIIYQVRRGADA